MASIFKRPDSSVWWVQYYIKNPVGGDLKKVRKTTGQRSRKLALAAGIEMERFAQGVMESGSDKARRAKAILAEAVAGIERETFNVTTARKILAEFLAVATGEDMPSFTVEAGAANGSGGRVGTVRKERWIVTGRAWTPSWIGSGRSGRRSPWNP